MISPKQAFMRVLFFPMLAVALFGSLLFALPTHAASLGNPSDTVTNHDVHTTGGTGLTGNDIFFQTGSSGIPAGGTILLDYDSTSAGATIAPSIANLSLTNASAPSTNLKVYVGGTMVGSVGIPASGTPQTFSPISSGSASPSGASWGLSSTSTSLTLINGSSPIVPGTVVEIQIGSSATSTAADVIQNASSTGTEYLLITTSSGDRGLVGMPIIPDDGITITATVASAAAVSPTVTTSSAVASIGQTTATISGAITATGGALSDLEGFNYTDDANYLLTATYDTSTLDSGSFGTGPFSASLTGLLCGTKYDFQAYAHNSAGTGYGSNQSFMTADCPVTTVVTLPDGGGHGIPTQSTVNFMGTAYPGAHVVIMKDGIVMTSAIAAPGGSFVATVAGIEPGSYVFSAYAQDTAGRLSASYSFPFYISARSIVNIGGILIAPTISLDKVSVKEGQIVTVTGFAAPNSTVNIVVDSSKERRYSVVASGTGTYALSIDTKGFGEPAYSVTSRMLYGGVLGPYSKSLIFRMNGVLVPAAPDVAEPVPGFCGVGQGDLNCDGHVNIVDFTIMKYWYARANPPAIVDLSGDGKITLKDFSILAADWTG